MEDDENDDDNEELININGEKIEDKKNKTCDNYLFAFITYFIQSLISIGLFTLYSKLNIHAESPTEYNYMTLVLFVIVLIFDSIIYYFNKSHFNSKHKKCSNYIMFILTLIACISINFWIF